VTVTVTLPVAAKVHDSVEVPAPPVTVDGESVHAELSLVKATSLANPLTGEIVMVDVAATPTVADTVLGLAEMVKSAAPVTVTDTAVEFVMALFVPPVPVIVTVKVVVDVTAELNVHVVVPVPPAVKLTVPGLHPTVSPVEGRVVDAIATGPANWKVCEPRLASVTVTLALLPLANETVEELEAILKPLTRIVSRP